MQPSRRNVKSSVALAETMAPQTGGLNNKDI